MTMTGLTAPRCLAGVLLASSINDGVLADVPIAYHVVSEATGVPVDILYAVALTESGKAYEAEGGRLLPWPWALNINGVGVYCANLDAALVLSREAIQQRQLVDIGLMQISWRWHEHRFQGIELFSSFTFGVAMLASHKENMPQTILWLVITGLLGLGFLSLELYEFYHFAHEGATPQTSGFWTAFFSLVGTHGLHVTAGLIWMIVLFFHFKRDGFSEANKMRLSFLSLFWHFLDIIWICVFSFVYLRGVM